MRLNIIKSFEMAKTFYFLSLILQNLKLLEIISPKVSQFLDNNDTILTENIFPNVVIPN